MRVGMESVFTSRSELLATAREGGRAHLAKLAGIAIACGAAYGFTMGFNHPGCPWLQATVSAAKVPALFLLTLVICMPTLHFVGLLFGSRARFGQSVTIMLLGVTVTSVLLAAFAPISLFFLVSGSGYSFLLLLHVGIFAFCGAAGLAAVRGSFNEMRIERLRSGEPAPPQPLLLAWMLLYMFVGCQTAFNLAPFIGTDAEFSLFSRPDGNFYTYVWRHVNQLVAGGS